jgi:predicted heme/steroid binding protein
MTRILLPVILILFLPAGSAFATPELSVRSGQGCGICHLEPMGGRLSDTGLEFAASGYVWPPEGGFRVIGPIRKSVRFFIGLVHMLAGFIWFGTILYVHLMLKPAYAEKGLPRGEVRLGVVSMFLVGLTGVLLTISRVKGLGVLYTSPWGNVLLIKVFIYLIMISSAAFVVLFIGPRLKGGTRRAEFPENRVFDPQTLAAFDGVEGRQALIAYEGKVFDVTALKLWKSGQHMNHKAGGDMTDFLPKAPHGMEKLEALEKVGTYDPSAMPPKSLPQRAFYVIAYMNLALVFCAITTIAYWRWGI